MAASGNSPEMFDAAAQAERTTLAWTRSLLALAANGALLVRSAATGTGGWAAVAGVVVLALALGLWLLAQAAYRRNRGREMTRVLAGRRVAAGVVVLVAAVGVADLAAVILAP